jgi:hypothetical protein
MEDGDAERGATKEPDWFARPRSDLEGGSEARTRESLPKALRDGCFRPMPVALLLVFGAAGGWLYCAYWMYRNWVFYRNASGYSRAAFWHRVHRATGYEISPFWRAVLSSGYCFCLLPAVERECRAACVLGVGAPVLLAFAFNGLPVFAASAHPLLRIAALQVWALVPVQLAINRLNAAAGLKPAFHTTAVELLIVAVGGYLTWR